MRKITIRLADVTDAELIAELSRQTFYETFASANTEENMTRFMEGQFSRHALMDEVSANDGIFLLAFTDNLPVGYVRMREGKKYAAFGNLDSIEIARIYALESAIGKGVGSALIKKCFDMALELKKKIIWLGVWENNKRAIDFYKKWGFEKFGEHEFILGEDVQMDWLMKKLLVDVV